ncbi:ABC-type cobalamin/Fe3+-siderophores transport system ATPase subunit [Methanococcus voltae]|uniref:TrlF family AAA-like ATPase n=1 Tax=Methanococcus voltae TaxID=2188 RepID=UPI001AE1596E|nr:hypothetical protein [Methanococcus voltae]MBP2143917.1 ABC-type cobalamin/Fe3+-siderophores transport system ATPase subunit [Methanococcus voltae]
MNIKYPRGSEWNIWDLHVHTPCSIINHYGGKADVWEKYVTDLENLPSEFKVLGINDYLFLDGYEKLLNYKKEGRLENIDTLLPVVEFRISNFAGVKFENLKRINLHVIFSEELKVKTIKSQFLKAIQCKYHLEKGTLGREEVIWDGCVTKESLEELGKKIKETSPRDDKKSDLKIGFNNLNVDFKDIESNLIMNNRFQGKYLMAVGKTEWDKLGWSESSISEKKNIINRVPLVFTASESVENYNNAKTKLKDNKVNDLLLDCSDAHYFSNSTQKDKIGNCKTWIKANTTFEGLKQIVYDNDRIKVQEEKPEQKTPYDYIKYVRFINRADKTGKPYFTNERIYLNQNLNSIIGGKSSGKSILLYLIAKTINSNISDDLKCAKDVKNYNSEKIKKYDEFFEKELEDFEVVWGDEHIDKYTDKNKENRNITYIPQMHLSTISENSKELNELVENIIFEKSDIKQYLEDMEGNVKNLQKKISSLSINLDGNLEEYLKYTADLYNAGSKTAITSEIERLTNEIKDLEVTCKLSESELEEYTKLKDELDSLNKDLGSKNELKNTLSSFKKHIKQATNEYMEGIGSYGIQHSQNTNQNDLSNLNSKIKDLQDEISIRSKLISIEYESKIYEYMEETTNQIINYISQQDILKEKISKYAKKLEKEAIIKNLFEKKDKEQSKLDKIINLETIIEDLEKRINANKEEIILHYTKIFENYNSRIKKINSEYGDNNLESNLTITGNLSFDNKNFSDIFYKSSNREFYATFKCFNDKKYYEYNLDTHISNISNIFEFILDSYKKGHKKDIIKNGETYLNQISALFDNYFTINYDIKYENDSISKMSEGKKGTVLLKLYLELNNSENPILIDQPEDNLDNRTVSKNLVNYIKDKKINRQIIIVSHNPNLVVSTDSENIIVANQDGYSTENKECKFEYTNGALEYSYNPHKLCDNKNFGNCDNCNNNYQNSKKGILYNRGIREHIFEILEGGEQAFEKRESKYGKFKR